MYPDVRRLGRWLRSGGALRSVLAGAMLCTAFAGSAAPFRNPEATDVIDWLPRSQPTARVRYAKDSPLQFVDVRVPHKAAKRGYPLVIFIHGGGWTADWNIDSANSLTERLADAGYAVMNVEYRRVGNDGGGYPGTFQDIAQAIDHARTIAGRFHFDLGRVVLVGHSAGGHLALWAAARRNLPVSSPLRSGEPLPVKGVIMLGGVAALEDYMKVRPTLEQLIGKPGAEALDARLGETSPSRLLPIGVPQIFIDGTKDDAIRISSNADYVQAATKAGDKVRRTVLDGANHFDLVDPEGPVLPDLLAAISELVGKPQ